MKTDGSDYKKKKKTTDIATKEQPKTLIEWIEKIKPQIALALPKHVTADRIARIAMTALRQNPKLGGCTRDSVLGGVLLSAQLGLELNTPLGQAWLIPRKNKKTGHLEAHFQTGYQGTLELAYRTKMYKVIDAMEVYENDCFSYNYGFDQYLDHTPADIPEGEPVKYYAWYETIDGGKKFRVWSRERVLEHAKKNSASWDSKNNRFYPGSSWADSFDGMAKKTVLNDVLKYAPKSVELNLALQSDERMTKVNPDDPDLSITTDYTIEPETVEPSNGQPDGEKEQHPAGEEKETIEQTKKKEVQEAETGENAKDDATDNQPGNAEGEAEHTENGKQTIGAPVKNELF